ncbi:TRIO and F-actin-binding protein [Eublepharis macularius]|uniref:TRIO and F-actin-binding protein n=1 Tax=Eublepharis macularius TaxID=481883 RepID=A0AA97LA72_EUBMA|nr:TRIO and F-actin-binding protein [Eublepharis macularius]
MSEIADYALCEKFEANVFAKSRCQNCFRAVGTHQHGNQAPEEQVVNISSCGNGTNKSRNGDQWDPLCILAPQCELYVCVGSEERAERCQESLEYTQLSSRAESEEKSEQIATYPDSSSGTNINADTNATLSKDWEMTRLLNSILGSDKQNTMYYAGKKQEARSENVQADRPRRSEATTSRSCGKTESRSCQKAEPKVMSQDHGDKWRKPQAESGYFSLERRKSEPSCMSSSPRAGRSPLPVHGNTSRADGYPASSISSADSNLSCRMSGRSESQHGLMRQEYTVLADLPKPKRLSHREAFEKERSSSRTRSPGRAEVERIFGHERRKSETLGAFQALEEGLLDRLDSKTLKLAKEGRLGRRKSSPTLHREVMPVNKRVPWEQEQPSRKRGESLHTGRPEQRPARSSGSPIGSSRSGSPIQRLEKENRSKGGSVHSTVPPQHVRGERRKQEEPVHPPRAGRERAPLHTVTHGKQADNSRKSCLETLHQHASSGKATESKWKNCLGALHTSSHTQSLGKGQASQRGQLERYKESDRRARGKPLLPVDTAEQPRKDVKDSREAVRDLSPGRGMAALGKDVSTLSPRRQAGGSWGVQGETRHTLSLGSSMGTSVKSHREVGRSVSPQRYTGGSQRETRRSLSPERSMETSFKSHGEVRRSPSPGRPVESNCSSPVQSRCCGILQQHPENTWKSQKEVLARKPRVSADTDWSSKGEQSDSWTPRKENAWDSCRKSLCPASPPIAEEMRTDQGELSPPVNPFWTSENNQKSLEGPLCHVHPMKLMEKEQISSREHLHFAKLGQQLLEMNGKTQASSAGWMENEWVNQERCQSPMRPEKQVEHDGSNEEKLLHQPQLDEGPLLKTVCSSQGHDPSLDTNQKHQPDLLNFKKGWMSILIEPGEWKKHWFVLTDSSLKYYRDSNAEEADDLDGEIDLRTCTDVTEYAVQRNYGFQIHTKDGVFTLSAMTSGIRRNWIEALRKSVRPASVPDVTKLSDCNKENSFRSYGSQKSPFRPEEQRPSTGSEVIPRGTSRKADGQRHTFDYVELSPLQHGPLNQGSPQRTRGSTRVSETKREELERDLALRSEERRKWFEAPSSGAVQTDGPAGGAPHQAGDQEPPGPPLSEAQRSRLSAEIEKKWQELERLPLKESKRIPLMALLNQNKGSHEDASEALEKEVQALKSQLESLRAQNEAKSHTVGHMPRGYISQDACERSLAEMEASHRQVMTELQRHHQREMERLHHEKERLLAEEAAATASAIEALKKAHREELNRELGRTRSFQKGGLDSDALQRQHQSDVESLKRELQVLSEQYSQKCLEIGDLMTKAEEQEQILQHCQQEGKELLRHNQELQRRLSEEIGQLRTFIAAQNSRDGASHNNERNSCELEVLLRVKENELQYLKKEVQCLKDELQMMQKDKRFASGKYQDVYVELNYIKRRSEREIEQLKEHLHLAMAALQEKETLHNSIGK